MNWRIYSAFGKQQRILKGTKAWSGIFVPFRVPLGCRCYSMAELFDNENFYKQSKFRVPSVRV